MTRSLNVLHIVANLGSGGVQRHLVQALAQLDRTHLHHYVCCVTEGGVYERQLRELDIPYRIMIRRARFDPTVIFQIAALMRAWDIDVVHTRNFTANAWGRFAAWRAGVPRIIAHERGTAWTENALMRWVDRRLYRITDVLLANSQAARLVLTGHVRVPPNRIRVVHNGIPLPAAMQPALGSLRATLGLDACTPLIGTVGRLDTPKGLPFLVRTVPLILKQRPMAHFVIIGDGPLRSYLATALADWDHVHLLGFRVDAPALMQDLDVLLHPAIREPLGNVLIEAALAGIPAVATAVDGIPEVILNGETGRLIPGTELVDFIPAPGASPLPALVVDGATQQLRPPRGPAPEHLAEAVLTLIGDPQQRAELGQRARQRMREHFSLARYVREVTTIYRNAPQSR
jgi:glycosyltransferase involved in cell wall biosynthesis